MKEESFFFNFNVRHQLLEQHQQTGKNQPTNQHIHAWMHNVDAI